MRVLVPKRKMRERKNGKWDYKIRTLFPGYVLLNGSLGVDEYYEMKGTPGIIKLLTDKDGPLEIREDEINVIGRLIVDNDTIGISNAFVENGNVIITDGPLLGMDGIIESIDKRKGRVKVRINFIGEQRLIELSINMLQLA
jgi:transcription termination/antitermination protein NusG